MCERCGDDSCDGTKIVLGVGIWNNETGEMRVAGPHDTIVPHDETALYDQLRGQALSVFDGLAVQIAEHDNADKLEVLANLLRCWESQPPQMVLHMLSMAVLLMIENDLVGLEAFKARSTIEGIDLEGEAAEPQRKPEPEPNPLRRCINCDRALKPKEKCQCHKR